MVTQILPNVYWVGVVDWAIRAFHGHELSTHRGTTYNAYLIRDEKTVLVDTVWDRFSEEFLDSIREICDPKEIDYVVANHAEPDHSGSLPAVMREASNAELIVSRQGAKSVPGHYHADWPTRAVGTGDSLDLGSGKLTFIEAPLLHWPDSMFSYYAPGELLLPNDAFGQHYATAYRFNDQVDSKELAEEAMKYYANILTPFGDRVSKKIDELLELGLPVKMIAPSHGVIWRDDPMQIVKRYQQWAAGVPEPRAVVLYDTMWEATRKMAEAIGEGLAEAGVDHKLLHMSQTDRNDALVEVFRSRTIVIGSPTLNNGLLPTVSPILIDLKGLKFKNKLGAAFGSYGWSGESVKLIEEHFASCGIPLVQEGLRTQWRPDGTELDRCRQFGREIAARTREPLQAEA